MDTSPITAQWSGTKSLPAVVTSWVPLAAQMQLLLWYSGHGFLHEGQQLEWSGRHEFCINCTGTDMAAPLQKLPVHHERSPQALALSSSSL